MQHRRRVRPARDAEAKPPHAADTRRSEFVEEHVAGSKPQRPPTLSAPRFTPGARLADLRSELAGLAEQSLEPNVFLEPALLEPAADGLGEGRVRLATMRNVRGELIGALAWSGQRSLNGFPVRVIRAWTHAQSSLSMPLLHNEHAAEAMGGLIAGFGRLRGAPGLIFIPDAPATGPFARILREVAAAAGQRFAAFEPRARAALATLDGAEDYLLAVPAKLREDCAAWRKTLEAQGEVSFSLYRTSAEIGAARYDFLMLDAASQGDRSETALLSRPAERWVFEQALTGLAAQGKALGATLRVNGRPAAVAFVLLSGGHAFLWKLAYDETFVEIWPDALLLLDLTRALIADGHGRFVESCLEAEYPLLGHVWRERRAVQDVLISVRPGRAGRRFRLVAAAENRRRALAARTGSALGLFRRRFHP